MAEAAELVVVGVLLCSSLSEILSFISGNWHKVMHRGLLLTFWQQKMLRFSSRCCIQVHTPIKTGAVERDRRRGEGENAQRTGVGGESVVISSGAEGVVACDVNSTSLLLLLLGM